MINLGDFQAQFKAVQLILQEYLRSSGKYRNT